MTAEAKLARSTRPAVLAASPVIMVATIPPLMGAMALRAYSRPNSNCPRVAQRRITPATPARETRMVLHSFFSAWRSRVEPRLVRMSTMPKVGISAVRPERSIRSAGRTLSTPPKRMNTRIAVMKVDTMPRVFRAI